MFARFHTHSRSRSRSKIRSEARTPCRVEALEDRQLLSYSFKALAFLGDPVPGGPIAGTPANFAFDFEPGVINEDGAVAFGADLSTGGEGVFLADANGKLTSMARTGDTAPDGATFGPLFLGVVTVNDDGSAAVTMHRNNQTFPSLLTLDAGLYRFSANRRLTAELLPGAPAPGGGTFHGFGFQPVINDEGAIAFGGLIETTIGPGNPPSNPTGFGLGVFLVDEHHRVSKVARPGDPAPGGKTFDFVHIPWLNDEGDVAFTAHVQEDPCIEFPVSFPAGNQIFCAESIYLRDHETGRITSIVHQGDRAPGGGRFTYAFGQKINDDGQIAFIGALAARPPGTGHLAPDENAGIFFHSDGRTIAIARPGDRMPGGGRLVTAGQFTADVSLNDDGVVSFDAVIDSDRDHDGRQDTALYIWDHGVLTRVVGTGDVIPRLGTVRALKPPDLLDFPTPFSGSPMNEEGQIALQLTVQDGAGNLKGVMLVATPSGSGGRVDSSRALREATGSTLVLPPQHSSIREERSESDRNAESSRADRALPSRAERSDSSEARRNADIRAASVSQLGLALPADTHPRHEAVDVVIDELGSALGLMLESA